MSESSRARARDSIGGWMCFWHEYFVIVCVLDMFSYSRTLRGRNSRFGVRCFPLNQGIERMSLLRQLLDVDGKSMADVRAPWLMAAPDHGACGFTGSITANCNPPDEFWHSEIWSGDFMSNKMLPQRDYLSLELCFQESRKATNYGLQPPHR